MEINKTKFRNFKKDNEQFNKHYYFIRTEFKKTIYVHNWNISMFFIIFLICVSFPEFPKKLK
jgi:hypothetical protein